MLVSRNQTAFYRLQRLYAKSGLTTAETIANMPKLFCFWPLSDLNKDSLVCPTWTYEISNLNPQSKTFGSLMRKRFGKIF